MAPQLENGKKVPLSKLHKKNRVFSEKPLLDFSTFRVFSFLRVFPPWERAEFAEKSRFLDDRGRRLLGGIRENLGRRF